MTHQTCDALGVGVDDVKLCKMAPSHPGLQWLTLSSCSVKLSMLHGFCKYRVPVVWLYASRQSSVYARVPIGRIKWNVTLHYKTGHRCRSGKTTKLLTVMVLWPTIMISTQKFGFIVYGKSTNMYGKGLQGKLIARCVPSEILTTHRWSSDETRCIFLPPMLSLIVMWNVTV